MKIRNQNFFQLSSDFLALLEGTTMNKELKKVYTIKIAQLLIYIIALVAAFLNRGISPNWPFYLLLIGILLGFLIPIKYRSNFSSKDPGIFLKNHTRGLENIIEMIITCVVIFLVIFLNIF